MPDLKQFKLPDVGEGLTEADIVKWHVAAGDTVVVNQMIIEIETAKAVVELPSPYAGLVTALHVAEGETVDVGRPIITIDVDPTGVPGPAVVPTDDAGSAAPGAAGPGGEGRQPVLVGYGPRAEGAAHRRRRTVAEPVSGEAASAEPARPVVPSLAAASADAIEAEVLATADREPTAHSAFQVPPTAADADRPESRHAVLAKPPVRKLAKSLGVDLADVPATGPEGTITRDDVQAAAGARTNGHARPASASEPGRAARETRIAIKGVRKHTAAAMVESAFTAPHVTEFMTADVTAMMQLRDRVAARREFRDVKLSPLAFLARAVILAARRTPEINSSWDAAGGEIVLKHYVNLGIAAATDRGLIVPNIKDADQLSLLELAQALGALTDTARSGHTSPADMSGGTITITNIGVFGIDTGTPILNPGEAGIVAFGAVRRMPWVVTAEDGSEQIVPRWVTQLAVSFDHRLVDGQQGSRFLADVVDVLADPGLALL